MSGLSVSEPRISVSSRPRARSMRSVKTWPRSGSTPSWASSIAAKAKLRPFVGFASDRHRFRGAQKITRALRHDPLLAGNERNLAGALQGNDTVVNLAGEQAQREADDARRMGAHALDRQIGLAGVGWTKDGPDKAVTRGGHGANLAQAPRSASGRLIYLTLTLFNHDNGNRGEGVARGRFLGHRGPCRWTCVQSGGTREGLLWPAPARPPSAAAASAFATSTLSSIWARRGSRGAGGAGWRRFGLLCASVAFIAPTPFEPLPAAPADQVGAAEAIQFRDIAIAPIGAGSRTGGRMAPGTLVEPLTSAPDRPNIELFAKLGGGDSVASMLARSGVSYAEAGEAARLIGSAVPGGVIPGTSFSIRLGRRSPSGVRPIERIALRAGLDLNLTLTRRGRRLQPHHQPHRGRQ